MTKTTKKSRILHVRRYLEEHTDEQHPATLADILAYLAENGVAANRRTVAQDIEELIEFGVDIVLNKSRQNQYFVGDRHFELPELKLLVDAVQASRFISPKKTAALTDKLSAFVSRRQVGELKRRLYTCEPTKSTNEKTYITVFMLYTAMNAGQKMAFKYYEYSRSKTKLYKHNGQVYRFSPYGLVWSNDRYYAVGFSDSHGKVVSFRVDRIAVPKLTEDTAVPEPEGFDMAGYARHMFTMYDGPARRVTLKCENALMNAVVDRFGEDAETATPDEKHFTVTADVSVGPTFYGWVFASDGGVEILAPEDVASEYMSRILSIAGKAR